MNRRDRVLTAIDRAEPDRVPVDFSANADTLARLYADLGCTSHRALLDRLGVDMVDLRGVVDPVYWGPMPKQRQLPGGVVENYWGWRTRRMETAMGVEDSFCEFVLQTDVPTANIVALYDAAKGEAP